MAAAFGDRAQVHRAIDGAIANGNQLVAGSVLRRVDSARNAFAAGDAGAYGFEPASQATPRSVGYPSNARCRLRQVRPSDNLDGILIAGLCRGNAFIVELSKRYR